MRLFVSAVIESSYCGYNAGLYLFVKQKTAYEMRISDWSSDVCSSDLRRANPRIHRAIVEGLHHSGTIGKSRALAATVCGNNMPFLKDHRLWRDRDRSEERRVGTGCVSQCR